jgi:hypothetical protein
VEEIQALILRIGVMEKDLQSSEFEKQDLEQKSAEKNEKLMEMSSELQA